LEQTAFSNQGLKWRSHLSYDSGMLFSFSAEEDHIFWMKDTYLSLDLIYLDSDYKVVGFVENSSPLSTDQFSAGTPSRYVVEVNAGWVEKEGLQLGDYLIIESSVK
jgi:uncharacterized protein